jgi:hypothetical protein
MRRAASTGRAGRFTSLRRGAVPEGLSPSEVGKEIAEHHFRVRSARLGLIGIGGVILAFSCVLLVLAPKPPV